MDTVLNCMQWCTINNQLNFVKLKFSLLFWEKRLLEVLIGITTKYAAKVWTKKMLLVQKLAINKKSLEFALRSWTWSKWPTQVLIILTKFRGYRKKIVIFLSIPTFRLSSIFFGSHLRFIRNYWVTICDFCWKKSWIIRLH